jgi:glycosyltransferase involved in cell wall biosynthesis
VDPYNAVEIANKIEEILSNKNLREYLINEWIEYSKKFSWEITAKNFIKLFESL